MTSPASQRRVVQPDAPGHGLHGIFDASAVTVLLVDKEGRIAYANHGLAGEPAATLVGQPVTALVPPEHEERLHTAWRAVRRTGAREAFEFGRTGPAGATGWWQAEASSAGEGNVLLMITDVTARRRTEEQLRRSEAILVDVQGVVQLGTWEWDVSRPHATWSDQLFRIYGVTPEEYTPSYEGYLARVHPEDRQRVMDATNAVFHQHVPYSHDERIFRADGTMRHLHTWAYPVLDEEGKLVRLVGVCQDVTDLRQAEGAMRTQTLTRAFARRLVLDLMRRGQIPERTLREMGRSLVREQKFERPSADGFVEAFVDMGLGCLKAGPREGDRFTFMATDLLEQRADSTLPTCAMTLGYVEGVVAAVTGRQSRGNEMRCRSMGHDECVFVVMAQ